MYSPEAMSKDVSSNLMYSSSSGNTGFKNGFLDGDFFKSGKEMLGSSSDLFTNHFQPEQNGSGLMRYRSAPSSFFASYLDGGSSKNSTNSDSSESDSMFTALLNCNEPSNGIPHQPTQGNPYHHQHQPQLKLEVNEIGPNQSSFQQKVNEFSSVNSATVPVSVGYQAAVNAGGGTVVGSYPVSIGVENQGRVGMQSSANSSNLIRQSSSPAGFFSGYDGMREVGNFRNGNGINGEASPATGVLNNQMNFTSGSSSSSRFMPTIAENGTEMLGHGSPDHVSGYHTSFNSMKRNRDGDLKMFSGFSGLDTHVIFRITPQNILFVCRVI
ncbi:OLC1v1001582C1 [Oldenlandia corymbosa var. corymbosa]|uniref:OLC1v1001582C1 n=1 Tax=Oldenlandia corymbosa var. corymbosa TaxID=529605 RepID=A0AAV1D8E2_OLDCO|nr:OLC1v1001582C1 [Oldenlandia corymbosa var. corymbosa]